MSPVGGRRRRGGGGEGASEQGDHRGDGCQWELVVELEGRGRDFTRGPTFSWAGLYRKARTKSAQHIVRRAFIFSPFVLFWKSPNKMNIYRVILKKKSWI